MMINKRLIHMVEDSRKYVAANVAVQWCNLAANVTAMAAVALLLEKMYLGLAAAGDYGITGLIFCIVIGVRFFCERGAVKTGYLAARCVKKTLRETIYAKLLRLGASYHRRVGSSEIVQVAVEGVDQLETYFGAYLPQFFFSMLAPLTLFLLLCFVNATAAGALLVCVPLIPVTIAVIQTWAKKLLSRYWGQYTALGDTFLENLQGLTTLKIYRTDEMKHRQMNEEAESFRKITMKVLTMQLNSITVMDLVTYGGTALGMALAVLQLRAGKVSLAGCLLIILLSADYFIPMRRLGSYFHIAMNGMAACDKIFRLLDLPEEKAGEKTIGREKRISIRGLSYSYEPEREILHDINVELPAGGLTALVGESGCGKSTIAGILVGRNKNYGGQAAIGGTELRDIREDNLMKNVTLVSHNSYLFQGTVRENLLMGNPEASEEEMTEALKKVKLYDFLAEEKGLDTPLTEKGANLSGGQRQRLALARALLHDTPIYIFDEAASNVDVESEEAIMAQVNRLAKEKTVILISHRLANAVEADRILVLEKGSLAEQGTHRELLDRKGAYAKMYAAQTELENYGREDRLGA